MAVVFDAKSSVTGAATTSVTWTHTPVGTPTAVGIGAYGWEQGLTSTWACTYGGTTVPPATTQVYDAGGDGAVIFGLANPSSGVQSVTVSSPNSTYFVATGVTVTGSDITTCFSASNQAIGTNAAPSITVAGGGTNDLVMCVCGADGANASMSAGGGGSNTTSLYLNLANGGITLSVSTAPGAASVTGTYSAAGSVNWAMMAASFKGPGPPPAAATIFGVMTSIQQAPPYTVITY
jgi:hypothetical protein